MNTHGGNSGPAFFLPMPKDAFQLAAVVIIGQMLLVFAVLAGCFGVVFMGRNFEGERCNGENAGDLMSFIAAQSFALLAAEKTIRKD